MKSLAVLLLAGLVALAAAAHVDLQEYPFSLVLYDQNNQYYGLHWNFTRETQSIYFAVNVSTTGWVGFGLSPNGQMPASDVVIGWVSGGQSYFHDRFAEARRLPSIDPSQDWFLLNSEEENGFTVLEFSRNFTTCDDRDLDITSSTDRVVWSFSLTDLSDPSESDAMVHDYQGSTSVNLIGGLPTRNTAPVNEPSFTVAVSNVTIPVNSTTYWCVGFRFPSELINSTHFINRFSPVITPHARSFVHHMLAYLCSLPIDEGDVGSSIPCDDATPTIRRCRGFQALLLAGWAVGGEDFIYPEGVAYPVGGLGQERFVVLEMHYDNPQNTPDVVDSSGFRFFYTLEEPVHRAGILSIGNAVSPTMIIPPATRNYTVTSICSSDCTRQYIPEGGIRIFANFLHTHLIGSRLVLEQYRWNTECNVWEELEPIDQNQNYDFNFQQLVHLPEERLVLPGDVLVLRCTYNSTDRPMFTYGGFSTREEMCLTFPAFYPRPLGADMLSFCISYVTDLSVSYNTFLRYLQRKHRDIATEIVRGNLSALSQLDWRGEPEIAQQMEYSASTDPVNGLCRIESGNFRRLSALRRPNSQCPYQPPDRCSNFQARSCCDRVPASEATPQAQIGTAFGFLLLFLSKFMAI